MSKILIVDDVADVCESLADLFSAMGHEARTAFDGQQAVDIARQFDPDIVFMDLDMPVLNGYEAARAIRSEPTERLPPFLVALTGSEGVAVEVATKAVGFDSYMRKPPISSALFALVENLAGRPRAQ